MQDYEVVVVSYRSRHQIEQMLSGLPDDQPMVIVDNAAGVDGLPGLVASRRNARYLDGGGRGFAHAANLGALSSTHDVVIFVNPDARPSQQVLDALASDVCTTDGCASSSAVTVGADGVPEIGVGGWEPTVGRAMAHAIGLHKVAPRSGMWARPKPGERLLVDWTSGACMAVRRDVFQALGGWDEGYYVYCEDVAFGRTARESGLHQRLRTDVSVLHNSGSSGAPSLEMMRLRGASMARYVRAHNRAGSGRAILAALSTGFVARGVQRRLQGDTQLSREHLEYARGLLTGRAYVAGKQVVQQVPGWGRHKHNH